MRTVSSHGFAGGFAPVFGEKWMKYSVEMIIWWKYSWGGCIIDIDFAGEGIGFLEGFAVEVFATSWIEILH